MAELAICTKRGLILRGISFLHCLHFAVIALPNKGTPQLLESLEDSRKYARECYHSVQSILLRWYSVIMFNSMIMTLRYPMKCSTYPPLATGKTVHVYIYLQVLF